jgi:hypothetical protein
MMETVQTCTHRHVQCGAWACLPHALQCLCDGRACCPALVMQTRNFRYRYLFKKIDLFLSGIVHFLKQSPAGIFLYFYYIIFYIFIMILHIIYIIIYCYVTGSCYIVVGPSFVLAQFLYLPMQKK